MAHAFHDKVVPAMTALRAAVDELELLVDKDDLARAHLRRPDVRGVIQFQFHRAPVLQALCCCFAILI